MELPRDNRGFCGLISFCLVFITGVLGLVAFFQWKTEGFVEGVLKFAVLETAFLFFAFFVLSVIWCAFTPRWVEELLERRAKRAMIAAGILFVVAVVWFLAVERFPIFDR